MYEKTPFEVVLAHTNVLVLLEQPTNPPKFKIYLKVQLKLILRFQFIEGLTWRVAAQTLLEKILIYEISQHFVMAWKFFQARNVFYL